MNPMVLPKIEGDASSRNYGRFVISPLESGFGITVGNALRRVLLSSLSGAAITSMRVSDVPHELHLCAFRMCRTSFRQSRTLKRT